VLPGAWAAYGRAGSITTGGICRAKAGHNCVEDAASAATASSYIQELLAGELYHAGLSNNE